MSARRKQSPTVTVELTDRALVDLQAIERYSLKAWGRKVADRYLNDIAAALDRLRTNPHILQVDPEISPDLHFYRVNKHVLVCHCHADAVIVLTMIHTAMNLPSRLFELEPRLSLEAEILRRRLHSKSKPS